MYMYTGQQVWTSHLSLPWSIIYEINHRPTIGDTTAPIKSPPSISNRKLLGRNYIWWSFGLLGILRIFNYHVKYRSYLDLQLEEFCVDPTPLRIPACSKSEKNAGILYRYWTPIMHLNCKGAHQKTVPAAKVFLFWSWNTSVNKREQFL